MDNRAVVQRIMKNLAFEVETDSSNKTIQNTSTSSKVDPLNVKIKVRKKEMNEQHNRGFISNNQSEPAMVLQKVRLVSSDGTIVSFDMFMEADEKKTSRKPKKHIFGKIKPGICLGATTDEDTQPYMPKFNENVNVPQDGSASKSDGKLGHQFTLTKNDNETLRMAPVKKTERYFLGQKCKPGGCLDPPFGEDKYSYKPAAEDALLSDSNAAELARREDGAIISKLNTEGPGKSKRKSKDMSISVIPESDKLQNSVSDLPNIDSKENPLITYPSDDKKTETKTKVSSEVKLRKSSINESNTSFFSPPKGVKRDSSNRVQRDSLNRNLYIPKSTKDKNFDYLPLPIPITALGDTPSEQNFESKADYSKQNKDMNNMQQIEPNVPNLFNTEYKTSNSLDISLPADEELPSKKTMKLKEIVDLASNKNDIILSQDKIHSERKSKYDEEKYDKNYLMQTPNTHVATDIFKTLEPDYVDLDEKKTTTKSKEIIEILSVSENKNKLDSNFSESSEQSEDVNINSMDSNVIVPLSNEEHILGDRILRKGVTDPVQITHQAIEDVYKEDMDSNIELYSNNNKYDSGDRGSHIRSPNATNIYKQQPIRFSNQGINGTIEPLHTVKDRVELQMNKTFDIYKDTNTSSNDNMVMSPKNVENRTSQIINPYAKVFNKQQLVIQNPDQDTDLTIQPLHEVIDAVDQQIYVTPEADENVKIKNIDALSDVISPNAKDFNKQQLLIQNPDQDTDLTIQPLHKVIDAVDQQIFVTPEADENVKIKNIDVLSDVISSNNKELYEELQILDPRQVTDYVIEPLVKNETLEYKENYIDPQPIVRDNVDQEINEMLENSDGVVIQNDDNNFNERTIQVGSPNAVDLYDQSQMTHYDQVSPQISERQGKLVDEVGSKRNDSQIQNKDVGLLGKQISDSDNPIDSAFIQKNISGSQVETIKDNETVLRSGPDRLSFDTSTEPKIKVHRELDSKTVDDVPLSESIATGDLRTISLNVTVQSYINNDNVRLVKTMVNENEPHRYPNDSDRIIKSQMTVSSKESSPELKIPVDSMFDMTINIKSNQCDQAAEYDNNRFSDKTKMRPISAIPPSVNNAETLAERKGFEQNLVTQLDQTDAILYNKLTDIYEKELIPLQTMIRALKGDIDYLQQQKILVKRRVICSKKSSYRNTKPNPRIFNSVCYSS